MTGLPIYDLRHGQCKFAVTPFDAKVHLFCSEPVEYEGCPYCPTHAEICFDRRNDQQRQRTAEHAAAMREARKMHQARLPPHLRPRNFPKF